MQVERTPAPIVEPTAEPTEVEPSVESGSGQTTGVILTRRPTPRPEALARAADVVRGLTMARSTFAGFCLTAFACGILTTVAIDRVWPGGGIDASGRYEPARPVTALPLSPPDPVRSAAVEIHQLPPPPAPVEIHQLPPPARAGRGRRAPRGREAGQRPDRGPNAGATTAGVPRGDDAERRVGAKVRVPGRAAPLDDEPKEPAPTKKWVDPFE